MINVLGVMLIIILIILGLVCSIFLRTGELLKHFSDAPKEKSEKSNDQKHVCSKAKKVTSH